MINITVTKQGEFISTIEVCGHSGYAESGSDIICSAVSTLVQNCEKGLKELLNINTRYTVDIKKPYLSINIPNNLTDEKQHDAMILVNSTMLGLYDLCDSFPKYISIKEKRK